MCIKDEDWHIGNVIRRLRTEQGISQGQLCRGLCSVATLSRIEAGNRDMDLILEHRVLNRLGYFPDKYESFESQEEFLQLEQRREIKKRMDSQEWDTLEALLKQYESQWKELARTNTLHRQFISTVRGWLLVRHQHRHQDGIKMLEMAIGLTVPGWKDEWALKGLLAEEELEILNLLAQSYQLLGEEARAYEIWEQILLYLERDNRYLRAMVKLYTGVICKVLPILLHEKQAETGLKLCEKGIGTLARRSDLYHWPELLYWKGRSLELLHEKGEAALQAAWEAYKRAYYACRLFGNEAMAEEALRRAGREEPWETI